MSANGIGMTSNRTRKRLVSSLRNEGITNEIVLSAIESIPRHLFVDEALASRSYEDISLPIGFGQTISSPFIVARTSELILKTVTNPAKILEIGTGCGYQSSILSRISGHVFSLERISFLASSARVRLRKLNILNVTIRHTDGYYGLAKNKPFDAIVLTAAASEIPKKLISQLSDGGICVMPIGIDNQKLVTVVKKGESLKIDELETVNFVPMLPGIQK